ncbi:uncharacterized protein [Pocillopora verrucosa]|uniref:uncharacterized protein n=1 Tax=Pocillopora verrucosa TaxID=203993 RepID=UPI00333E1F71
MVLAFRRRSGFLAVFILAGISAIESQQSGVAPDLRQSSPPRVVKPVGEEEVKLTCYVKYAQNYTWYKNHKKIHQPADRYVVKTPRYLRITDVLKSDSGTFVCIASNKYGTVNCTIRLIVEDPTVSPTNGAVKPHFLYPDKMAKATAKLEYTEGDKFQLHCDAKGTPTPTVTWYRGKEIYRGSRSDETITPGRYHYIIYFNGVDVKDAGNYTCVVKNSYGTLTHSYVFDVKEKIRSFPQILYIWEQKKPEYAGTDLQMHAIVLSKDENTKFFWYFSKSFVPDETNLGTLINQTLSESRLETLPSSGVSWLKWKVVLNLKNLSVADSGSYWCQAENIVGTVQRQTPLNVTTRPITPSPSEAKTCQADQFTCADKSCIPLFWKCDGLNDCHDRSDENGCPTTAPLVCSKEMFRCDGDCIKGHLQCDGKNDCGDGSDERGCDEKTRDALVPGIVSAGVLITVAALSFICWRRRSRTKELVNGLISMSELEFEYDAFVIFSSQDSDWVTKILVPTLEEKHGFKCCVHYRDFVVGVPFLENMVNSVYKSRKTIAVVSKNFFNSNYCGSEMDYALHRLMEKRDNSLVVIKLDEVGRGKLPKELRKRSFIDLSKNVEKEHWERKLVQCFTIPSDLSQEQIL